MRWSKDQGGDRKDFDALRHPMSLLGKAEEHRGQERVLCSLALASCAAIATSLSLSFPICRMG